MILLILAIFGRTRAGTTGEKATGVEQKCSALVAVKIVLRNHCFAGDGDVHSTT
ncbi:MAG: hypothetical protein V1723_02700 [Candidatus Uhrbacteria bacterium]